MLCSSRALRPIASSFLCPFGRRTARTSAASKADQIEGLFGVKVLDKPSGFRKLNATIRQRADKLVKKIVARDKEKTTVALFDDLSNEICCAADLAECVRSLHSEKEFAAAAEESMRDFTELVESLNTNSELYSSLKNSLDSEADRLSEIDRRTLHLFLADFEQSGIQLPDDKKREFVELSSAIFDAGSRFTMGADEPVSVSFLDRKMYGAEGYLTNPFPMTMCRNTRRWAHTAYYKHNEKQEACLRELITCRHRLAHLTGFPTFAHRAQQFSLLGSYDNVHNFLTGVVKTCRPAADRELAVLMDVLSQCETNVDKVGEWDIQYLCSVYRRKAYGNLHSLSRYFSFENVLRGIELLAKRLYDIEFLLSDPVDGEIWPGNVIKIEVQRGDQLLGLIYLDVEKRPSKTLGDCHFTVRCSKLLDDGSYQLPIVVLSLSVVTGLQSLLSVNLNPHQAENFFHEMGHALHSMLGRTKYQHVAGTRCPTDMAEVPSNLMEYFFNDLNVLREIAKDEKGEPISVEDVASLITSRFAFSSLDMMQQAIYSLFDLELHGHNAEGIINGRFTTTELFASIWSTVLPSIERNPQCAWHHRFTHFVPYGAKYSSYLVARAAASLIWSSRFRDDPFSKESGRLWAEVQSHGGALPSTDLLQMALGYYPTSDVLVNTIKNEANMTCQFTAVNL